MQGAQFKARALVEGKRYAKDRMVFLRELAQNSRDAGARTIRVTTRFEEGAFVLRFEDDGSGMSFEHAEQYLFRLYASSKENEKQSAGRFGVGFWSILLFEPDVIDIESRTFGGPAWRVVTDGELSSTEKTIGSLEVPGTVVSVRRRVQHQYEHELLTEEARASLIRHCQYLRRNDRAASPLPIRFNEHRIDAPFKLDGPCFLTFSNGKVEGAVGLGETPSVEVYARGLWVWQGTVLDELAYGAKRAKPLHHPKGLSPRFLLNGNDLNVTYNRRKVVDDNALARLRLRARKRMRELITRYLDRISPRPLGRRLLDGINAFRTDIGAAFPKRFVLVLVAGALLLTAAIVAGVRVFSPEPETSDVEALDSVSSPDSGTDRAIPLGNPRRYFGASTEPFPSADRIPLAYRPGIRTAFRIAAVEHLDPRFGIRREPLKNGGPLDAFECRLDCLEVAVEVKASSGPLIIPVPTGHLLDTGSVRLNDRAVPTVRIAGTEEPALWLDRPFRGYLTYRTGPAETALTSARARALTALPSKSLPQELELAAARLLRMSDRDGQLAAARGLVEERLLYDNSEAVSARYAAFFKKPPKGSWLDFVLGLGRGDCDVKNAVLVFLLRRLGIPSRLAIGPLGADGHAEPGMHAWTEYFSQGWKAVDATGTARVDRSEPAAVEIPVPSAAEGTESPNTVGIQVSPPWPSVTATPDDTASEDSPETAPPFYRRPEILKNIALAAALVGVTSLVIGVIALFAGRKRFPIFAPGGAKKQQVVAADILAGALAHPEIWMMDTGLKKRPLLPVLGRDQGMSLDEARSRGQRSALWMSKGECRLVKRAVEKGAVVLDAGDGPFKKVISRLPGIVDLDEIAALKPLSPAELPEDLGRITTLVKRMNRILVSAGLGGLSFRLTFAPLSTPARDIDLTSLGFSSAKHVVVPARSEILERAAASRNGDLPFAAFTALSMLMGESAMLREHRAVLLRRAARTVFEEAKWTRP